MSATGIRYPHAIIFPSGNPITQLTEVSPDFGFADFDEIAAGQTAPQFTGSSDSKPGVTFRSRQLGDLLALMATEGVCGYLNGGNTDLLYKAGSLGGTRTADASTAHTRLRMASNVFLYWEGFTASQSAPAELQARLCPIWLGSVDPWTISDGVALSGSSAVQHVYTLGPVKINGSFLGGVESLDWANQVELEQLLTDGDEFYSWCSVNTQRPILRIRTRNAAAIASFGNRGTALTALSVYLRKRTISGINVADGTAAHIKFTATAGTIKTRGLSGQKASADVYIALAKPDAATAPYAFTVGAAIT